MSFLTPEQELELAARLRYFRDLGIYDFYRRGEYVPAAVTEAASESVTQIAEPVPAVIEAPMAPVIPPATPAHEIAPAPEIFPDTESVIPPRKPITQPPAIVPEILPAAARPAALEALRAEIGDDCTRCPLAFQGRHKIVFADGNPNARILFVGEGPGADEDAQGLPFVGKAGQLLNNMIGAMGLKREEVYIANVVKCRPPKNRQPEPDEANVCMQFLWRQIDIVRPEVIVALGATAVLYLMGQKASLASWRGRIHELRGSKLIVTYHPAFLLRDPNQKKEAWKDLQIAMKELGLKSAR
ncbi:uracil-DNA glycosylase [Silvibacterium sp.]|uniref:uracil-DNA glycosylase n=1 Tax=Silvibacterium sp. TaxID=1964179 RepID=UPI0039E33F55